MQALLTAGRDSGQGTSDRALEVSRFSESIARVSRRFAVNRTIRRGISSADGFFSASGRRV